MGEDGIMECWNNGWEEWKWNDGIMGGGTM